MFDDEIVREDVLSKLSIYTPMPMAMVDDRKTPIMQVAILRHRLSKCVEKYETKKEYDALLWSV